MDLLGLKRNLWSHLIKQMSKRGGKTSPIGSPDQDAPAAPLPSAGNPVEGIQPEDSMDPVVNQGDVTEKLKDEIEAHSKTKSMAKKREAEFNIYEQAQTGHEQRAKDLLASLDSSERKRESEAERWLHARKLIVALEDLHWERATSQSSHDADGWREWLQRYERAIQPLIRQTRA